MAQIVSKRENRMWKVKNGHLSGKNDGSNYYCESIISGWQWQKTNMVIMMRTEDNMYSYYVVFNMCQASCQSLDVIRLFNWSLQSSA